MHYDALDKYIPRDERMRLIGEHFNVAAFVSFDCEMNVRLVSLPPSAPLPGSDHASLIKELIRCSPSNAVNVRLFRFGTSTGARMHTNLKCPDAVANLVRTCLGVQDYAIVSEAIPVNDGGVSGVVSAGVMEFLHGVTPRFVDQPQDIDFPQFTADVGARFLAAIYGSDVSFSFPKHIRVEFSAHPNPVGIRGTRMVIWDAYKVMNPAREAPKSYWPNAYSEWIGDKLYGELAAWSSGFKVPETKGFLHPCITNHDGTVLSRWTPPAGITFGKSTGSQNVWLRSSPSRRRPGHYPTRRSSKSPLSFLMEVDPIGLEVRSCLRQQEVEAHYSGAAIGSRESVLVEGVIGDGSEFMMGKRPPTNLPPSVLGMVEEVAHDLVASFGDNRFEWAVDGSGVWILQVNPCETPQRSSIPLEIDGYRYIDFDPDEGLDCLQAVIELTRTTEATVRLSRNVGLTSHVIELLNSRGVDFVVKKDRAN